MICGCSPDNAQHGQRPTYCRLLRFCTFLDIPCLTLRDVGRPFSDGTRAISRYRQEGRVSKSRADILSTTQSLSFRNRLVQGLPPLHAFRHNPHLPQEQPKVALALPLAHSSLKT